MKKQLKIIDGSKDKLAPRPHHGLIRAVYDTIEACGGANVAQIKKYLPAAIDNVNQVLKKKRLERALYNGVYCGYLIHDDTSKPEYWRIAPLDYYKQRQKYVKEVAARSKRGSGHERGEYASVDEHEPWTIVIHIEPWYLVVLGILAALVGGVFLGRVLW